MKKTVNASSLYKLSNKSELDRIISIITKNIDAQIYTAHYSGYNQISFQLPTNLTMTNMEKDDAQTFVYSELLKIYGEKEPIGRGFKIKLSLNDNPTLFIQWVNGMDINEKEERLRIIKKYSVSSSFM